MFGISPRRLLRAFHRVATSLNNLAALYQAPGRYAEAEPLYQRSLAIREKGALWGPALLGRMGRVAARIAASLLWTPSRRALEAKFCALMKGESIEPECLLWVGQVETFAGDACHVRSCEGFSDACRARTAPCTPTAGVGEALRAGNRGKFRLRCRALNVIYGDLKAALGCRVAGDLIDCDGLESFAALVGAISSCCGPRCGNDCLRCPSSAPVRQI